MEEVRGIVKCPSCTSTDVVLVLNDTIEILCSSCSARWILSENKGWVRAGRVASVTKPEPAEPA